MVKLDNMRLFATMNSSKIDGDRTRLPRVISNLFIIVQLHDDSENEFRTILNRLFQSEWRRRRSTVNSRTADCCPFESSLPVAHTCQFHEREHFVKACEGINSS